MWLEREQLCLETLVMLASASSLEQKEKPTEWGKMI